MENGRIDRAGQAVPFAKALGDYLKASGLSESLAHKAIRAYLKRKDRDLDKLSKYAKQMRKPLDDILTVLLSDE